MKPNIFALKDSSFFINMNSVEQVHAPGHGNQPCHVQFASGRVMTLVENDAEQFRAFLEEWSTR